VPWAAAIWARCHESDAAVSLLHAWAENFVNEGRGTLHNTAFTGPSALVGRPYHRLPADARNGEVMQLDAGMGALTAVFELLVQCVQDRIRVLPSIPRGWRRCRFDGIRSEGAFLIGADLDEGRIAEVRVHSLKGGALRLEHGLGEHWRCGDREGHGPLFERVCRPGERLVLTATRQTACP
jgi:hypothetical protein